MGNCPKCDNATSIVIKYENNEVIILNEAEDKDERISIIRNIEGNSQNRKFINLLDYIYQKFEDLSDGNISFIKITIKQILESISNNIDRDLKLIDDFIKDKYNIKKLKSLINLFIFIYSRKDRIGNDKIIYFIESINTVLKESKTIILEKDITFFINHLKNIFQIKNKENDLLFNPSTEPFEYASEIRINWTEKSLPIERIQNDQVKGREISREEENSLIKNNKKMTNQKNEDELIIKLSDGNDSKLLECKESKSSNFSKYSKNSQHQILKMEKENEEKENLLKLFLSGVPKKIIFYDEKEKKEYPLMIPNEEILFESIIKLFFYSYPALKEKIGGSYTYKNKTISLKDKIEINENDKINF